MTAAELGYADVCHVYADLGWAPIKLAAGTKFPPPTGFTGSKGAYPSGADRQAWAEEEPGGNVAVRLADGFVGIDEDRYGGKTGGQTIVEAERRWGPLPPNRKSTSRGDGSGIRIYRVPAGLKFVEKLEFPELGLGGVDVIQPHHRYVVCWPSTHPEGREYYWLDDDGTVTTPPRAEDVPELPAAWVEGLREAEKPTDGAELGSDGPYNVRRALTEGEPSRRVAQRLGQAILDCYGGGRHDDTRNHVLALLRYGRQGDTGVLAALTALQRAFVAAVEKDRPGGRTEAEKEFRKFVRGKGTGELLAAPDLDTAAAAVTEVDWAALATAANAAIDQNGTEHRGAGVDPLESAIAYRLHALRINREAQRRLDDELRPPPELPPVRSLDALLAEPDSPVAYRVDRLAPTGARVMCSAQYKAGKTTLVGNLARALVDDEPFLGAFTIHTPARRLVLIDDELGDDMVRRWLREQRIDNTGAVADVVTLRGRLAAFNPTDDRNRARWAARLADLGADYLVLDCLGPVLAALGLDENRDVGVFLAGFDALLGEAGIDDSLTVHHMGHTNERARGASRLQDWPDAIWRVVRESDDPASPRFFSAYGRDVNVPEGRLSFDQASRRLTYAEGSRGDAKTEDALRAVVELLAADALDDGAGLSGRAVEDDLSAEHTQKAIRAACRLAVERGLVSVTAGKRGAKLHRIAAPCSRCGKPLTAGQSGRHQSCAEVDAEGRK